MLKRPELLAPVGRPESFYAAIENGANAVYVGGKQFSARQYALNLDSDELKEIVEYAKLRGVSVYITVNTLIKNNEMDALVQYLHQLSEIGVDAIIIQDFGIAKIVKEYFPNLKVHASTQMSAHSQYDVKFLKDCGYKRVVLARELSLDEIRGIKDAVDIEIETFVHGALCVSYSGQCLMSSFIGGRSGNRGRCAQPCRLPYSLIKDGIDITDHNAPYLMSPKDMQALDILDRLIEVGINTFKIEGRMKTPDYIASVVRIYNKYIDLALADKDYEVELRDKEELLTVFNRGGFTQGYFTQNPGHSMMAAQSPKNIGLLIGEVVGAHKLGNVQIKTNKSLNPGDGIGILTQGNNHYGAGISKQIQAGDTFQTFIKGNISIGDQVYLSKDHELSKELTKSYNKNVKKSDINVYLKAKLGHPLQLDIEHETGVKVSVQGDIVEVAQNAPMSLEKLSSQVTKFGETPFGVKNIIIENDANIFVSTGKLNKLRRQATQELIDKLLGQNQYDKMGYERYSKNLKIGNNNDNNYLPKTFSVNVRTMEQLVVCLEFADDIYWELDGQEVSHIEKALLLCQEYNVGLYIALPFIERQKEYIDYEEIINKIEQLDIKGYLIRTYGQYQWLKNSAKKKNIDYTLNVMNNESISHWETYNIDRITLSLELSADEIREIKGKCLEMVVYGYIPIMTTEQCVIGRYGGCPAKGSTSSHTYNLVDRKGEEYPLITNCQQCRMQILSSKPIILANKMHQIEKFPIQAMRLNFTTEDANQIREIISWYKNREFEDTELYSNRYFVQGVK